MKQINGNEWIIAILAMVLIIGWISLFIYVHLKTYRRDNPKGIKKEFDNRQKKLIKQGLIDNGINALQKERDLNMPIENEKKGHLFSEFDSPVFDKY